MKLDGIHSSGACSYSLLLATTIHDGESLESLISLTQTPFFLSAEILVRTYVSFMLLGCKLFVGYCCPHILPVFRSLPAHIETVWCAGLIVRQPDGRRFRFEDAKDKDTAIRYVG